jgi:NitT/TauT family transport system substrate-binding protein
VASGILSRARPLGLARTVVRRDRGARVRALAETCAVAVAALALAACAAPPAAAPRAEPTAPPAASAPAASQAASPVPTLSLTSVALAYTTTNAGTTPMWLAQEAGLFREQGLDTTLVRIPAGTPMLAALQNRDVVVAMAGGPAIVDAVLHGGDQVIVGSLTNYHNQALYGAASYPTVESLRGQAVGVSRYGASSDVAGREALRRSGLEPGRDVAMLQTGGNPESVAALQTGTVQGIVVSPPLGLEARRLGLHLLIDITSLRLPSPGSTVTTTRPYLREEPAIVEKVLRAVIGGVHRFETDQEAAMAAIAHYTDVQERDVLDETYAYFKGRFQRDLYPSLESIAAELQSRADEVPAAATTRPEEFVDLVLIERLRANGYADALYR